MLPCNKPYHIWRKPPGTSLKARCHQLLRLKQWFAVVVLTPGFVIRSNVGTNISNTMLVRGMPGMHILRSIKHLGMAFLQQDTSYSIWKLDSTVPTKLFIRTLYQSTFWYLCRLFWPWGTSNVGNAFLFVEEMMHHPTFGLERSTSLSLVSTKQVWWHKTKKSKEVMMMMMMMMMMKNNVMMMSILTIVMIYNNGMQEASSVIFWPPQKSLCSNPPNQPQPGTPAINFWNLTAEIAAESEEILMKFIGGAVPKMVAIKPPKFNS